MRIETVLLSEIGVLPELFLGISIIYLVLHCTFLAIQKKYPLIQTSVVFLGILVLFLSMYLLVNDSLNVLGISCLNNTIINDYLSSSVKTIIASLSLFCLLIINQYLIDQKLNNFEYVLLILFSVLGLFLLCSANDLITAYLAIELQSLSFYVLASFKKKSTFSVDAGVKYFILGAFSSCLFLLGSSLLYCGTGTLCFSEFKSLFSFFYFDLDNMDYMTNRFFSNPNWDLEVFNNFSWFFYNVLYIDDILRIEHYGDLNFQIIKFGLLLILISLFFKLAVVPFHVWAPDVYEKSPSSSTFFFSVVPKLAIFVLMIRIFCVSFLGFINTWRYFIIIIVVLSILVGSFGGLEQRKLKSLFVYSSISHMGYSLIAFNVGTFESIQSLLCYLIVYSFSGLCIWTIFILTRLKNNHFQKQNKDLTDLSVLSKSNNTLAIFFCTVLFSVAGFPPMIGFLVKISIFLSSIEASMYFVALISILCSVVGTFYYIRLVKILFFEQVLVGKLYYPINTYSAVLLSILFYLFLFLFINPTLLFLFSYKLSLLTMLS